MRYNSDDLNILDEMIQDNSKEQLSDNYGKKQVILTEFHGSIYSVTIRDIPDNTIVIKPDSFESPQTIFKGTKGECKRADFVLISDQENKKFILFIEMKAGKAKEKEVIQQLKGAKCFINYCKKIGRLFWDKLDFLDGYDDRFISIKDINLPKRPTRDKASSKLHNRPENMLKICSSTTLQFNRLIGK